MGFVTSFDGSITILGAICTLLAATASFAFVVIILGSNPSSQSLNFFLVQLLFPPPFSFLRVQPPHFRSELRLFVTVVDVVS